MEDQIVATPMLSPEDIKNRFEFHPADTDEKRNEHERIRKLCLDLANELNNSLPNGREKATAISRLEEVMFWANAAIARVSDDERTE